MTVDSIKECDVHMSFNIYYYLKFINSNVNAKEWASGFFPDAVRNGGMAIFHLRTRVLTISWLLFCYIPIILKFMISYI